MLPQIPKEEPDLTAAFFFALLPFIYYSFCNEMLMLQPSSCSPIVYRYFSARAVARAARNLSMATWTSGENSVGNMMAVTTRMQWERSCGESTIIWNLALPPSIINAKKTITYCFSSWSLAKQPWTIDYPKTFIGLLKTNIFSPLLQSLAKKNNTQF